MAEEKMAGRTKAAVLLITLGDEPSSKILKYLNEKEIEGVTFEIARHPRIDPGERDKVVSEFSEMLMAQEVIQSGGIDYARSMLEKSLGTQRAMQNIEKLTASIQVKPFDFIKKADPAHIMNFIQGEHPQTIALILSYLDAKMSSAIIGQLPLETQADVAKRITTIPPPSPSRCSPPPPTRKCPPPSSANCRWRPRPTSRNASRPWTGPARTFSGK